MDDKKHNEQKICLGYQQRTLFHADFMPETPMQSTCYRLFFQRSGQVLLSIDDKTYRLLTNDFLLARPGTQVTIQPGDPSFRLLVIDFRFAVNCQEGTAFPDRLQHLEDLLWLRDERGLVIALLQRIIERNEMDDLTVPEDPILLSALFAEMGILLMTQGEQTEENAGYVKRACWYIERHYHRKLSVDEVANHLGITGRYLQWLFKKELGETVLERIQSVKLEKATALLEHTDHTMVDIADFVGLSNQQYFATLFKKKMGVTPSVYRRQKRTSQN